MRVQRELIVINSDSECDEEGETNACDQSVLSNLPKPLMRVQQELIVINSDSEVSECDEEGETNACDQSVIIMDTQVEKSKAFPAQAQRVVDEDLVITFSQRADVLSHARYDCPVNPFQPTNERKVPTNNNVLICEQCYCFICDKLASQCVWWTVREACHCNSHRSDYWKGLRNAPLLGLKDFNISLSEMDTHLRDAGVLLESFKAELNQKYLIFLMGQPSAAQEHVFIYEMSISPCHKANVTTAKALLYERVLRSVQRQMVLADFSPEFTENLLVFSVGCIPDVMRLKLHMRPWNDALLVSVLRGQNGFRKIVEDLPVILLRVQHLQNQHRFRELCRYLPGVLFHGLHGSQDLLTRFQEVADLLPLYTCLTGDFSEAMNQFVQTTSQKCPTHRLSPFFFRLYLKILETGTAPVLTDELPTQTTLTAAKWERIEGAVPQPHSRLVALSIRVMKIQKDIYSHSGCWEALLGMVNTPTPLEKPSPQYLEDARIIARTELKKSSHMENFCLPVSLQEYPQQGLLLLMSEALAMRIAHGGLEPAVPVVNTYKDNEWAFRWLCDSLMLNNSCICQSFMKRLLQELPSTPTPAGLIL